MTRRRGVAPLAFAALMTACAPAEAAVQDAAATGGWSAIATPAPGVYDTLSCASATSCVATLTQSSAVDAVTYSPPAWSVPSQVGFGAPFVSLSCPTPSFCAAISTGARVLELSKGSWSSPVAIAATLGTALPGALGSVSCASASFCVAVDAYGDATTFDGHAWSKPTEPGGDQDALDAVSCPTFGNCIVVSGDGNAYKLYAGKFGAAVHVDPNALSHALVQLGRFVQRETDVVGDVVTLHGSSWSKPTLVDPFGDLTGISCPSVSSCVAIDGSGHVIVESDRLWSAPIDLDSQFGALIAVSCPGVAVCYTIDGVGNVYARR